MGGPVNGNGSQWVTGDVVLVTGKASCQFDGRQAMTFRIVRVLDIPTYAGWAWIDGYQLDQQGDAGEYRSIYVRLAGLELARPRTHPVVNGLKVLRMPRILPPAPTRRPGRSEPNRNGVRRTWRTW